MDARTRTSSEFALLTYQHGFEKLHEGPQVVAFIDARRDRETGGRRWGVEPICAELQVAPSTYYAARSRPPSARALRNSG